MVQELVAVTPLSLSSSGCTASLHNIGGREQGYCTSVFPNTGTQTLPAMFSAVPNGHKLYSQGSVKCVPLAKVIQLFKSVASVLLSASTHKAFTREPVVALFGKTFLLAKLVQLLPSMKTENFCARFLRNTETGTQTEVQFNGVAGDIMGGHPPYRPLKTLLGDP